MINPITHADTPEGVDIYKVEPYVVAADVYTAKGHLGRGGWTWYTGSASWMYRIALEAILGFRKRGEALHIEPCIPATWKEFSIEYRHGSSTYVITIENPDGVQSGKVDLTIDGAGGQESIPLVDDGKRHEVTALLRSSSSSSSLSSVAGQPEGARL
jgi:cyclic beta-1,2-glucan synthetase